MSNAGEFSGRGPEPAGPAKHTPGRGVVRGPTPPGHADRFRNPRLEQLVERLPGGFRQHLSKLAHGVVPIPKLRARREDRRRRRTGVPGIAPALRVELVTTAGGVVARS